MCSHSFDFSVCSAHADAKGIMQLLRQVGSVYAKLYTASMYATGGIGFYREVLSNDQLVTL